MGETDSKMTVDVMLSNMAVACQEKVLLEPHVQGAVLRSIRQWITRNSYTENVLDLSAELTEHENYEQ